MASEARAYKRISDEMRQEIYKLVLDEYRPVTEVATQLGIGHTTVSYHANRERNARRDAALKARQAVGESDTLREYIARLELGMRQIMDIVVDLEQSQD